MLFVININVWKVGWDAHWQCFCQNCGFPTFWEQVDSRTDPTPCWTENCINGQDFFSTNPLELQVHISLGYHLIFLSCHIVGWSMIINQSGTCQEVRCLPDKATLLHKTQFSWNHIYRSGLFLSNICLSTHNQLDRVPSLSISHESRLDLHSLKTSAKELQIWVNVAHFNDNRPLQIGRRPIDSQETQVSIFISLIQEPHCNV